MKNFKDHASWLAACHAQSGWRGPYAISERPHLQQFVNAYGTQAIWNGDFITGFANIVVVDSGNTPVIDSGGGEITSSPQQHRRHRLRRRRHKRKMKRLAKLLETQGESPIDDQGGGEIE